ncbi:DUF4340 domain-containing protein [Okeania sp. KiyG1]|uniref:DUF4340 domain-containing protein n=1 Tax=Okeania sp. KiyG1 TaxID=2720165 RepID=UPI00192472F5|nr:DUF4340 domain-containing protein [Okeania sp. KiyG1]GGA01709.1 hypothetical protein CYANOKiyG1_13670 [Okeania sp. KiyG1]
MKIKRTTLILILTALALGGFVYFYEIRGKQQQAELQEQQKQVFNFESEEIQAITIKQESEILTLTKDENAEEITWKITAPVEKEADLLTVEFLLDQITGLKSDRSINTPVSQLSEYGLEKPEITVEIKLQDDKTRRLFLGKADFDGTSIYSQVEAEGEPPKEVSVLLLSVNFKNVLTKPVAEWEKQEKSEEPSAETEESTEKKNEPETAKPSSEKSPEQLEESTEKKDDMPREESSAETEESTEKKDEPETAKPSSEKSPEQLEESTEKKDDMPREKSSPNPELSPSNNDDYLLTE